MQPTAITFNTLLLACAKAGRWAASLFLVSFACPCDFLSFHDLEDLQQM